MMYDAYQGYADLSHPVRQLATNSDTILRLWSTTQFASPLRRMAAYYELVALAGFTHTRPPFAITEVATNEGATVAVTEQIVMATPFCSLVKFTRSDGVPAPRVLLVAPMSGHFATLLRGTIKT